MNLSFLVLKEVAETSVEHSGRAFEERRCVLSRFETVTSRLDPDKTNLPVILERVKDSHRVRAAANARDNGRRQASDRVVNLLPRFFANDRLEVAHHPRIRSRPHD